MKAESQKLIELFLNDEASEEEIQQLLELCRQDPQVLSELNEQVQVERLLRYQENQQDPSLFKLEIVDRLKKDTQKLDVRNNVLDKLNKQRPDEPRAFRRVWWAAAAAVILCVVSFFAFFPSSDSINLATVTSTYSLESTRPLSVHQTLGSGPLTFDSGLVELQMTTGVSLIIEGPAHLDLIDTNHVKLHQGKVTSRIPPGAEGFVIETPEARLIDLGTVFAIDVSGQGRTDLHVLKGKVRWERKKEHGLLTEHKALRFSKHEREIKTIDADERLFVTQLPGSHDSNIESHHWSFDRIINDRAEDIASGSEDRWHGTLKSHGKSLDKPRAANGQFGDALYFNGTSSYVETEWPGIGGSHARTVCFWMKSPVIKPQEAAYGIVSWGSHRNNGNSWQISVNPRKGGPIGGLRIGNLGGQVVGHTDLRDNRWHHVAVVLYGGRDVDTSTHILLYVDGRLEKTTLKSVNINTDVKSQRSVKVSFGRDASKAYSGRRTFGGFKGWLDEVFIINKALSEAEIRNLMTRNALD